MIQPALRVLCLMTFSSVLRGPCIFYVSVSHHPFPHGFLGVPSIKGVIFLRLSGFPTLLFFLFPQYISLCLSYLCNSISDLSHSILSLCYVRWSIFARLSPSMVFLLCAISLYPLSLTCSLSLSLSLSLCSILSPIVSLSFCLALVVLFMKQQVTSESTSNSLKNLITVYLELMHISLTLLCSLSLHLNSLKMVLWLIVGTDTSLLKC